MVGLLEKPERLEVQAAADDTPESLVRNGRTERIEVFEHWRIVDRWWGKEVRRDCYRIATSGGLVGEIYRDGVEGGWFLSRVHD